MGSEQIPLPDEIIYRILSFGTPPDVIRARSVSKRFRAITYDHELWKELYANACMPRLPGPFPHQSTRFLERTLVRSARVAQGWTTNAIRAVSSTLIRFEEKRTGFATLLCGRWFISCESFNKLVVHDTDPKKYLRKVIWRNQKEICDWRGCSMTFAEGERLYIVIAESDPVPQPWYPEPETRVKILEFRVNSDSDSDPLNFSYALDLPSDTFGTLREIKEKAPFLCIRDSRRYWVVDVRTRIVYGFPESRKEDGTHFFPSSRDVAGFTVLPSSRYILTFISYLGEHPDQSDFRVHAFAVPANPRRLHNGTCVLRLTHESTVPVPMFDALLIRDSIVDPLNGSTSVRFLSPILGLTALSFRSVDLTIPEQQNNSVLPISVDIHDVLTIQPAFLLSSDVRTYIYASDDGWVRGLCRLRDLKQSPTMTNSYFIVKFAIDATQENCVADVGKLMPSQPNWGRLSILNDYRVSSHLISFDGVRGRFGYVTTDRHSGSRDETSQIGYVVAVE